MIETSQYPAPLGREYAPLSEYKEKYRGVAMFWKFDRQKGRIDPEKSWAIELPPYTQDLADAGKLDSDGWAFINSFNTEMAIGGTLEGKPPIESRRVPERHGLPARHQLEEGRAARQRRQGHDHQGHEGPPDEGRGADEGVLTLVGEPKSPHGCDVTPDGTEIVVGGKLDTHATVYDFAKMKALIEPEEVRGQGPVRRCPILALQGRPSAARSRSASGPLHTVFDDKGFAYTSVFIESVVAKWSLKDLKTVEKLPVHYNIGHIMSAEGDTVSPDGKYVVAMNKMSHGPLHHGRPARTRRTSSSWTSTGEQDAHPRGHAHRHRRAALLADDQDRQAEAARRPTSRAPTPTPAKVDPHRGARGGKEAHRAQRQQGATST